MGLASKMNEEQNQNKITKEGFKEYTYVMVSTLNQMVNYIPLKHFEFKEVYNITIADSLYADNAKWDKNLEEVLEKSFEKISFKQNETNDIEEIKKRLKKHLEGKTKIFWNITGGQRPFILAINQIANKDDVICYLEGNKNQMVLVKDNIELKGIVEDYSIDSKEDLNIKISLGLMGFKTNEIKSEEKHIDLERMEKFYKAYKESKELIELLIDTNSSLQENEAIEKVDELNILNKDEVKKVIKWGYEKNKSTPFGYILEEITYYLIQQSEYAEKILELKTNVRIYFDENSKQIDEFDLALLTKNGKFIIFECKSGGMKGDVAKSTKYSTYAVSGVYGLPILITPFITKDDITNRESLDKNIYGHIVSAINAAERAGLEVWGLDEIENKLKKYIKI